MPLQQLPTTGLDDLQHQKRHREVTNQILTHQFDDSRVRTAAEILAGVTPTNFAYVPGDVRRYGAIADASADGTAGTDSTFAIQTALNIPVVEVLVPKGNFLFTNLTIPSEKVMKGVGIHQSNLIAAAGSTGTMFTDQGSAAKVSVHDVAFYGNNNSYTAGFRLGYNGTAHGTEGFIDNVWVRDLPSGFPGIDINGNVGHYGRLLAQNTGGLQIVGVGNMADKIQSFESSGFTVSAISVATNFQLTHVNALEIEATDSGVVPLYLTENSSIDALTIAPTAGATYPHLIEIGAGATTWFIEQLELIFASGSAPTITNGNIKSGSLYFGGNASGKNNDGEGNYASSIMLGGRMFGVSMQQLQSFTLRMQNPAGTIQHRIGTSGDPSVTSNFVSRITGATTTANTTPTGADASTAFTAGVKIGSASTNVIHIDTEAQIAADSLLMAGISFNNTGAAYTIIPFMTSTNINGVTRVRLAFSLQDATTGANVAWSTAINTNGDIIDITAMVYLR